MTLKRRHRSTKKARRKGQRFACIIALMTAGLSRKTCGKTQHCESLQCIIVISPIFFSAFAVAAAQDQHQETLPRPQNYYELLNLESQDTHRRPKTFTLHNRKFLCLPICI